MIQENRGNEYGKAFRTESAFREEETLLKRFLVIFLLTLQMTFCKISLCWIHEVGSISCQILISAVVDCLIKFVST